MNRILLVEDDDYLRDGLREMLLKEGYYTDCASRADEAEALLGKNVYDLMILDVMLPDGDGFSLCTSVRERGGSMPILFLTACDDELQIVRGLDAGGDDYVTKPFKLLELLSRIRALLRRNNRPSEENAAKNVIRSDGLEIDTEAMTVRLGGKNVFVTPTEFRILSILVRSSGVIVTRERLLGSIWDSAGSYIDDNTLSVHIGRLREKIGAQRIKTVRGVGYRWEETK